jgi:hypothetical protein
MHSALCDIVVSGSVVQSIELSRSICTCGHTFAWRVQGRAYSQVSVRSWFGRSLSPFFFLIGFTNNTRCMWNEALERGMWRMGGFFLIPLTCFILPFLSAKVYYACRLSQPVVLSYFLVNSTVQCDMNIVLTFLLSFFAGNSSLLHFHLNIHLSFIFVYAGLW